MRTIHKYCLVSTSVVKHCLSADESLDQSQPVILMNTQIVIKTCSHAKKRVTTMPIEPFGKVRSDNCQIRIR